MSRRPLVSVVAPAFNEAGILEVNLNRLCDYLESLEDRYRWELIVVDDGSTDETAELARGLAAGRRNVRVHRHALNQGLGRALCTGFRESRGDYIVVIDLDLTYSPEHIDLLLEKIRETGAEVVIASPYMKGGRASEVPFLRKQLSRWGNRFLALTARGVNPSGNISTLTGMVRAYDARFIRSLNLKSAGTEINTEVIYKATILGARIEEIPAHLDWGSHKAQQEVRSSSKRLRRGIVFGVFAGFIIRPFAFFIVPAALLAIFSIYPLTWVTIHVVNYYQAAPPSDLPFDWALSDAVAAAFRLSPHAFIIGGITVMLSVQLFSLGVLALQVKQYFEELFHFGTRVYSQSRELERLAAAGSPTAVEPAAAREEERAE